MEAGGQFDVASRFEEDGVFAPEEQIARLQVVVSSRDFIVHTRDPQELRVPRTGASRNKARFDLEPRKDWIGTGEITALFYKDNNFIQGMTLLLNVGSGERVFSSPPERLGRPLEGLSLLQPRDLLLFIKKAADGFDLTMVGAVAAQAFLRISPQALNEKIVEARNTLLKVVYLAQGTGDVFVQPMNKPLPAGTSMPYQFGLDIPEELGHVGLEMLAEAGWLLFEGLFYGDGMGADAHAMGDILRAKANEGTLKLQIVSQEFFLPWGLLYMAEFLDPENIQPENFLGMKHIIEHIPLQSDMQVHDERIPSQELAVSLNLDTRIDAALKLNVIADQRTFWDQLANKHRISLELRENSTDFLNGMRSSAEQILYFYGHAVSQDLSEDGGSGGSSLSFSDQKTVTLRDLKLARARANALSERTIGIHQRLRIGRIVTLVLWWIYALFHLERGARHDWHRMPGARNFCRRMGRSILQTLPVRRTANRCPVFRNASRILLPAQQPPRPLVCTLLQWRARGFPQLWNNTIEPTQLGRKWGCLGGVAHPNTPNSPSTA